MEKDLKKYLIDLTIKNKDNFPYINLVENNIVFNKFSYKGWVTDFNLINNEDSSIIKLDLRNEKDLFLLFVLASAWSRTGPWENAVFFTTYIKLKKDFNINTWSDSKFIKNEIFNKDKNCKEILEQVSGILPRKKVAFRNDLYNSVFILAQNWLQIKSKLKDAYVSNNWKLFIDYLSSIEGLGSGKKRMRIKIPLILRELKCQNIYNNIDGKYCCVADERVRKTYIEYFSEKLPLNYLKASEIIWNDFGELYDIPPFAYEDLKKYM